MTYVKVLKKTVTPIEGKQYSKIDFEFNGPKGAFKAVAYRGEKVFESITEGNSYELELKQETERDGTKIIKVSPPPMAGGAGGGGNRGGGYRPNPHLDMVKTAATQASRIIETLMNSSVGDKVESADVMKWTKAFFDAQKELYDAAEKATPATSNGQSKAAEPATPTPTAKAGAGEQQNIGSDLEDDLPFSLTGIIALVGASLWMLG